ncbi:hypothetical protein DFH06DRAFT_1401680 [Mycena polygramma]|nr:hypothetical protein DFH06DRAFT_1401680 [Mycena polygramma]
MTGTIAVPSAAVPVGARSLMARAPGNGNDAPTSEMTTSILMLERHEETGGKGKGKREKGKGKREKGKGKGKREKGKGKREKGKGKREKGKGKREKGKGKREKGKGKREKGKGKREKGKGKREKGKGKREKGKGCGDGREKKEEGGIELHDEENGWVELGRTSAYLYGCD